MNEKTIALFILTGAAIGASTTYGLMQNAAKSKEFTLKLKQKTLERQNNHLDRYLSAAIKQMTPEQLLRMLHVVEEHDKFDQIINDQ